jgi:hypothetical protein
MWSIAIEARVDDDARLNLSTEIHGGLKELQGTLEVGADAVNAFFDRLEDGDFDDDDDDDETLPDPDVIPLEAVLGVSHAGCGGLRGTPFVTTGNITPAAGVDFPNGFATLVQCEPLLPNQPRIIFIISED